VNIELVYERLASLARRWRVTVVHSFETPTSVIAYGQRAERAVVLKLVKQPGDEWNAGEVLLAFGGKGVVPVLEHMDGAMLIERLDPGTPLVDRVRRGNDADATEALSDVIAAMDPGDPPRDCPTVEDWGRGFARYRASGDDQVPPDLVSHAERVFHELAASQGRTRLLHGDLQHYNVLFDRDRGWVAIDPKGVVGELEYEIGAALRNPGEKPDLLANPFVVDRRLATFTDRLNLDAARTLEWAFAQAVLSAIWTIEDVFVLEPTNPSLKIAATLRDIMDERR
jgi:streptomycin 6-kinase